jgi:hypothetical protein
MIQKIDAIVFSYNRAMQLDATLHSFYIHCIDAQQRHLVVLYRADDPRHARQYQILANDYPQVTFYSEKNFQRDTLKLLTTGLFNPITRLWLQSFSTLLNSRYIHVPRLGKLVDHLVYRMRQRIASRRYPGPDTSYLLLLVDDNIFVRDFSMSDVIQALELQPEALGFSLRLGKNTSHNYTQDVRQPLPSFVKLNEKVLSYAWPEAGFDFGYPLEVSSSIYRAHMVVPLIATLLFSQPNNLEARMASSRHLFRDAYPRLLVFETSVTFCDPVNRVQQIISNRAGESVAYTAVELADRFERGERIDVDALEGFIPHGCHQEVALNFCNSSSTQRV